MTGDIVFDPAGAMKRAWAQFEAQRPNDAVALLQEVLEDDPDNAEALYLSGVIAYSNRFIAQAVDLSEQALEVQPDFADAHLMLGNALTIQTKFDEALTHWRRALVLRPGNAAAHANIARVLQQKGEHAAAGESARRATNLDPEMASAQHMLGASEWMLGRLVAAEPALREAIRLRPDVVEPLLALTSLLLDLGRHDEARAQVETALTLRPDNLRALRLRVHCMLRSGVYADAEAEAARLTAEHPRWAEGWTLLGVVHDTLGRFDQAKKAFARALEIDPNDAEAHRTLASIGGREADAAEIERLSALFADTARPAHPRTEAGFALAKRLDDSGRFDEAFAVLRDANKMVVEANRNADDRFDAAKLRRGVDLRMEVFTREYLAEIGRGVDPTELPVFIVGMPRSGTTLVEQILASHSQVFGAGELPDLNDIAAKVDDHRGDGGGSPQITPAALAAMRETASVHLAAQRKLAGEALRITDKMPDNIFHLGIAAAVYPSARVIICRRDPRDVCLSCFFQRSASHGLMFAYDLADCGRRALEVERLAAHWRAVLPMPVMEVQYEELVADLEGQSRRLIAFLGLEWEPQCIDFHQTERPVWTASAWQVRQPLYSSSVGRWRNYASHLGPLLAVLSNGRDSNHRVTILHRNNLRRRRGLTPEKTIAPSGGATFTHYSVRIVGFAVTGHVGGVVRPSGEWRSDAPVRL
jgi:tetratricopeptide (TPR) repeat protein